MEIIRRAPRLAAIVRSSWRPTQLSLATPLASGSATRVPLAGPVMVYRGWSSKSPSDNGDGPSEKSPRRPFQSMLQEEPAADVADDAGAKDAIDESVPSFQSILGNNAAAGPSDRRGRDAVSPPPPEVMRANEPKKKKKNRLIEPLTGQHSQPELAVKFVNCMMRHGKKNTAQKIFDDMLSKLKVTQLSGDVSLGDRPGADPMKIFLTALENLKPTIGLAPISKGGTIYQVPVALHPVARQRTAIRWLIDASRKKKGTTMATKLSQEVMAAYRKEGSAYSKKMELHKTAEANRAYAGFARR